MAVTSSLSYAEEAQIISYVLIQIPDKASLILLKLRQLVRVYGAAFPDEFYENQLLKEFGVAR